jgi:hypothetical protein
MEVSLPQVWHGGRESIQVAFYPDRATYLETAITSKEVDIDEGRLTTMLRSRIDMTTNARDYLLSGWHDRETFGRDVPFRWADGRATFYLPAVRRSPQAMATRVRSHPNAGLEPTLDIRVNGVSLAQATLHGDWQDVHVRIPDGYLKKGANIVELLTTATRAADIAGPAVAVQAIEIR